jgi:hypothetical protein
MLQAFVLVFGMGATTLLLAPILEKIERRSHDNNGRWWSSKR